MAAPESPLIECRFGDPERLEAWEAGRVRSRERDHFNSPPLLRAIHRHLVPLAVVECWRGGEVVAGCHGWDDRWGGLRRLHLPPTIGHGTLWFRDEGLGPSNLETFMREVCAALTGWLPRHFDAIELCAAPEVQDLRGFQRADWQVLPEPTPRGPLTDPERQWNGFEGRLRRAIKHGRGEGYAAGPSDDIDGLAAIMTDVARRRLIPAPPLRPFAEELVTGLHASRSGQLFMAHTAAGEAAAAALIVWERGIASYYVGGVSSEHGRGGAHPLVFWAAIEWLLRERPAEVLDLYGVVPEEVGHFKKQFNFPLVAASRLLFVASPRLRAITHARGLWASLKRMVRGRRFGVS
jgi:hypothetical protein